MSTIVETVCDRCGARKAPVAWIRIRAEVQHENEILNMDLCSRECFVNWAMSPERPWADK